MGAVTPGCGGGRRLPRTRLASRRRRAAAPPARRPLCGRPGSRGQSYRPPASDEEQLRTGWLFSSSDEDDLPAARAGEPARASPTARSLLVPLALLPILLPLCAGSLYFGTKGLDGKQLEAVLPKAASQQAMLPKKADLGGLGGLISKPAPAPAPAAKSSAGGSSSSTPFGSGGGSGGSGLQLPGGLQLPTFSLRF